MEGTNHQRYRGRGNRLNKTAVSDTFARETELPIDSSGARPSIVSVGGQPLYTSWELDGKTHRVDGPAIIYPDGSESWYQHAKLHREDGPAMQLADGQREWWQDGMRHREGGPAVIHADGTEIWIIRGFRHREDGPAVTEASGKQEWWLNGHQHRLDGPAVIHADGTEEWWVEDKLAPQQKYAQASATLQRNARQQDLTESLLAPRIHPAT